MNRKSRLDDVYTIAFKLGFHVLKWKHLDFQFQQAFLVHAGLLQGLSMSWLLADELIHSTTCLNGVVPVCFSTSQMNFAYFMCLNRFGLAWWSGMLSCRLIPGLSCVDSWRPLVQRETLTKRVLATFVCWSFCQKLVTSGGLRGFDWIRAKEKLRAT